MKVDIKDLSKTFTKQTEELLMQAAQNVMERAKQRCPVTTGALRDSITITGADNYTVGYAKVTNNIINRYRECKEYSKRTS